MSQRRRARSRVGLFASCALLLATQGACRNRKQALPPVQFDPVAAAELSEGDRHAAPVWSEVERQLLANGLLVHGLHEASSPDLHLRLLLPTSTNPKKLDALSTAVALGAIEAELKRRLRGLKFGVATSYGPGRVEIIIRASERDAARVLDRVGLALAREPSDAAVGKLLQVQASQMRQLPPASAATAFVLARLLDLPPSHLLPIASQADKQSAKRAWRALTDPRESVLVVHSGAKLEALAGGLDALARRWKADGVAFRAPSQDADRRLRPDAVPKPGSGHLLTAPASRLWVLDELPTPASGGGKIVLGRLISTPTPELRARARLAQRLLQQRVDARLIVAGPVSVLLVVGRVSASDPLTYIKRLVEDIDSLSKEPIAPERMTQASRLWLGARVVQASLEDEDWTGLWSEALDLSLEDGEAGIALARDAKFMLETTPAQLQAFAETWLRPRHDEGGWVWALAGASEKTIAALDAALSVERVPLD